MSGKNRALAAGVRPREVWAWAMYDFANSGFTTVVITALFNAYFVAVVAGDAPWATFAWTAALSASYALIIVSAPLIGAIADQHAAKKRLLAISTLGCVSFTALLWFAQPGAVALAIVGVIAANFFFGTGENLIAAFLPELARPRALGRVSGWGWSLGYLGGLFTLGICLVYVTWSEAHGRGATDYVPASMLITAAIFLLASLPTFLLLKERAQPNLAARAILDAWREVWQTLQHVRRFADLARFLVCSLFYQAGIQAVIALAAIYATQAMGFGLKDTLLLIFVVNITAAIGAFFLGYLQDRLGHRRTIALTLSGWIVAILLLWAAKPGEATGLFWFAANLAGLCLGAAQSAGRALVGLLAPATRRAEFFGFWGLSVKLSSILGPLGYGLFTWVSGNDHRGALLLTGGYFVLGLMLLAGVDVTRGRRAALAAAAQDRAVQRG
ncbi:MFS transporter [Sulfuricystis multivorans]|uniref:MFS transporter n=1 Tax=Sulfuricystis multivorans TaxID=2211108 RepID=UPI000F82E724|nr:MFS transporter [Sulfuricystis multivorans]